MVRNIDATRDYFPCPKCNRRTFKILESKKVVMSNARRRRYECTSCGERATHYEVTDAFYNQAIENERILHQLRLYIDKKSGLVNKHVKDCSTCEYNDGNVCSFEVPEFDTEEAEGCTYYQIKKWKTSPGAFQAAWQPYSSV